MDLTKIFKKRENLPIQSSLEQNIARFGMILVGIVCVFLSVWYTRQFFIRDSELPVLVATFLAGVIAIFNSLALTANSFLIHNKKYIMAVVLIPIWLATTSFDIFTVMGSQSYKFQLANQETIVQQEQTNRTDLRFSLLQTEYEASLAEEQRLIAEESRLSSSLQKNNEDLNRITVERSGEELDSPRYVTLTRSISALDVDRRNIVRELATVRTSVGESKIRTQEAREKMMSSISVEEEKHEEALVVRPKKVSFADWLHQIFPQIPLQYLQLFLITIPAVFIDLISPIAMNFGLTLATSYTPPPEPVAPPPPPPPPPEKRKYTKRKKPEPSPALEAEPVLLPEEPVAEHLMAEAVAEIVPDVEVEEEQEPPDEPEPVVEPIPEPVMMKAEPEPEHEDAKFIMPTMPDMRDTPSGLAMRAEDPHVFEDEGSVVRYRFGKTTASIANKLVKFVNECIDNPGPFKLEPNEAAKSIGLNNKAKEVFLQRLASLKIGDQKLITHDKYGDYSSNFTAEQIITYATEVISE
jgi:hypothetical protein